MNKKILLVLILIAATAAFFLFPSDEKKIRNNLDSLAEYCSSASKETAIAALKKVALAGKLCSDPCMIQIESFDIHRDFKKKELTDHILMMKKMLPDTHFTFHDTTINFPLDNRAELTTTLRLTGKIDTDRFTEAYELSITADKIDGDWLFSSFSVVEFMEQ
jgi:hypothetical protein